LLVKGCIFKSDLATTCSGVIAGQGHRRTLT
jgi:hypothetical protein